MTMSLIKTHQIVIRLLLADCLTNKPMSDECGNTKPFEVKLSKYRQNKLFLKIIRLSDWFTKEIENKEKFVSLCLFPSSDAFSVNSLRTRCIRWMWSKG